MRIGVLHNAYRYRGGEDMVVDVESKMLESDGHHVSRMIMDSTEVFATLGKTMRAMPAMGMGWNTSIGDRLVEWAHREELDIVHCHNIFPIITPAALLALHAHRIPIVMSLHNFRPICANGLMIRDGKPCDECVTTGCASAIKYSCYRSSHIQSASWTLGRMRAKHHHVWERAISRFIAPSQHVKDTYTNAGFDASAITVRPHSVPARARPTDIAYGAIYVGRLEQNKGAYELAQCWPNHAETLTFIGKGPDADRIKDLNKPNIICLGWCEPKRVAHHMSRARVVLQPSRLNETFGLTIAEGASVARPAIAFNKGASGSIIDHQKSGILIDSDSMSDFCNAAVDLLEHPTRCAQMGRNAFENYTDQYTPQAGLRSLIDIYTQALTPTSRISA